MNKKNYFIAIHNGEIKDVDIPDGEHKFEVVATYDEIKEIENLMAKKTKHSGDATKYLAKPFNEQDTDSERNAFGEEQIKIFEMVYELGTIKTKQEIDELGILRS